MKFLSKWSKELEIFGVVLFYNLSAISTVIVNKFYLRTIPIPLSLLLFQMVVSSVILSAGYILYNQVRVKSAESKPFTVLESMKLLWPMVLCNIFGLALNIICLSKIDSIVHQVTRSMTLPLTAIIGPLVGSADTCTWKVYLLCFTMFTGFLIALSGEFSSKLVSIYGTTAGFVSSLINAYGSHFIKNRMASNKFSALDLVFYNNIYSTILLAPMAITYEYSALMKISNWNHVLLASIITGILGVSVNYAGFLQIKVTTALTHCVSSAARGMIQIAASFLLLKEHLSISRGTGISISLIASSLYPIVKRYDNNHTHHKSPAITTTVKDSYSKVDSELTEITVNTEKVK